MPGLSTRRIASDSVTTVAGCAWLIGLVAWYAGASAAIDRTLDAIPLFIPVAIGSVLAGLAALALPSQRGKGGLGNAIFLAGGLAFIGFELAVLGNCHADDSPAHEERGTVLSFKNPTKGPPTIAVRLNGEHVSFQASHADGCDVGDAAILELRSGMFGAPWMQAIRCKR
jgi:hypothetical protein